MEKLLYALVCFSLTFPIGASGQIYSHALDSTKFTFTSSDSLTHYLVDYIDAYDIGYIDSLATIIIDTSGTRLWQTGNTLKPVFSNDTTRSHGIMTDTLHPYPANVSDFFVIKMYNAPPNPIIDVWHEYQTDPVHAGGIIEFSTDSGLSWVNIVECSSIYAQNIYSVTDTLLSGEPAFAGNSGGQQLSHFQFITCVGSKPLSTGCYLGYGYETSNIFVRFRFMSDFTTDTLSGWKIDSIMIEDPGCYGGYVSQTNKRRALQVYPNPSYEGLFSFSPFDDEVRFSIEIYNNMGNKVLTMPYKHTIDLSKEPCGMYFYKVSDGHVYYTGKLLKE